MKILLIGEFSRLHNSLKEGLIELGCDVVLIGTGDQFKKYPVDINISSKVFNNSSVLIFFRKLIHKITKFDIAELETYFRIKKIVPQLNDFDFVQFINEDAFYIHPKLQIPLLESIFKQNSNAYLLSCGDDYISISHYLKNIQDYSILTPYLNDKSLKSKFNYSLKYTTKPFENLHHYIYKNINGVIASDLDYHIPLKNNLKYLGLIPNPINTNKLSYFDLAINDQIIIFHGVNKKNYIKKGNNFFEDALHIIKQKYADKVTIISTENLPYNKYIESYNQAHIVLDQVYAYDQGYNALEAMAKGKVVFTGAEKDWLDFYNLTEDSVAINALPDAAYLVRKLEWLIQNPEKILEISRNARAFIEREHHHITIAEKYLDTWKTHSKD